MDFSLSEEQGMLKESARSFLEEKCPKEAQREILRSEKGYSPEIWREMASLGWQGLYFPEKYGGSGMGFTSVVILLEEMNRVLLPSPFFSSVILGGLFILEAGSEEQKKNFLSQIASGDKIFTLALTESDGEYRADAISTKAVEDKGSYLVSGVKLFVPDAAAADYLICVARTNDKVSAKNGLTIFIVDAKSSGITCHELKTAAEDKQYEVMFEKVRVPKANILDKLDNGWAVVEKVLPKVYIAESAQMTGGLDRVLELILNHVGEKVQGERIIGSYQVIQHMLSDIKVDLDISRLLTYEAAWKIEQGLPVTVEASMAKAWLSNAYSHTTIWGQQLLGGAGYLEDPDMGLFTRKAKSLEVTFGDTEFHREKVAQELGL